jgi:hypothetical protein
LKFFSTFIISFLPFIFFPVEKVSNYPSSLQTEQISYYHLGDKTVPVKTIRFGDREGNIFINLHDDETTSVEAGLAVLQEQGGLLIKIENDNQRLISFILKGKNYQFGPNRMFTKTGIEKSLKKYGPCSMQAVAAIAAFADSVLAKIPQDKLVIALHNNNEEGALSIKSYQPGGSMEKEVEKVFANPLLDPDDFFFTTDVSLYKKIAALNYNVALQNNRQATDDGSLSVVLGWQKKPYVNIEAEHGHILEQVKMIRTLFPITPILF